MSDTERKDYVGICRECGSMRSWISSDCPRADIRKFCADVGGNPRMSLEQRTVEESRAANWNCAGTCEDEKKRQKVEAIAQLGLGLAPDA